MRASSSARRGVGTFVADSCRAAPPDDLKALRTSLQRWVDRARAAGLDDENIAALFADTTRGHQESRVA